MSYTRMRQRPSASSPKDQKCKLAFTWTKEHALNEKASSSVFMTCHQPIPFFEKQTCYYSYKNS